MRALSSYCDAGKTSLFLAFGGAPHQIGHHISTTSPWHRAQCPPRPSTLSCAASSFAPTSARALGTNSASSPASDALDVPVTPAAQDSATAASSTVTTQSARAARFDNPSSASAHRGAESPTPLPGLTLAPTSTVGGVPIDTAAFLTQHWGVKPLFLPRLMPDYASPLSPDDLAGLACEDDVESRIVTGRGCGGPGETEPYTLTLGPFDDAVFSSPLCADGTPWTLLVQEVNRHIPDVADVLDRFRLLPNWRVDDVMVSYATTGGSVGPHVDNYDVFLLQVAGKRRWRTSSVPISAEDEADGLVPDIDIRVLKDGFDADQDHILSPGDCMYVSPRCPHWGESLSDDCMTFSIGFRAPAIADLAIGWAEERANASSLGNAFLPDVRPDLLANAGDPGRISDSAIDAAYGAVLSALSDGPGARDMFRDWFCQQVSAPKRFREALPPADESISKDEARDVIELVLCGGVGGADLVRQQEGSVFAYAVVEGTARLYVDGEIVVPSCSIRLASLICARRSTPSVEYAELLRSSGNISRIEKEEVRAVLVSLLTKDHIYVAAKAGAGNWQ